MSTITEEGEMLGTYHGAVRSGYRSRESSCYLGLVNAKGSVGTPSIPGNGRLLSPIFKGFVLQI